LLVVDERLRKTGSPPILAPSPVLGLQVPDLWGMKNPRNPFNPRKSAIQTRKIYSAAANGGFVNPRPELSGLQIRKSRRKSRRPWTIDCGLSTVD
jgi:hypothetical protein